MVGFEKFWISIGTIQSPRRIEILKKISDPNGIRTPVAGMRGWCPMPLDDGTIT